jgi:hypothetical protein
VEGAGCRMKNAWWGWGATGRGTRGGHRRGGTVGDVDGRKRWKGVGHAGRGCGRTVGAGARETGGGGGMEGVDALLNFLIGVV